MKNDEPNIKTPRNLVTSRNGKLCGMVGALFLALCAALFQAASQHQQWHEFWISASVLVISALFVVVLLWEHVER